ncbi:hypothetical protein ACFWVC_32345 [Streptomyces sp. NPDC058691]|uniref:hypothetical protein n=1 Tax=Streptomyces sp. NPDC058691 TaxID=3346601 RepID=UPI00364C0AFC
MAGRQEFAAVYGVKGTQITQWLGRGVMNYDHAVIVSGSPYWLMSFVRDFGKRMPRPKQTDDRVVQQILAEQEPGEWATSVAEVPPLLGLQETTQLFGLSSQQNMSAVFRKGGFVPPDYSLSGSPIWLLDTLVDVAAPMMQARARTVSWAVDPQVEAAFRQKRYTGPGSVIVPRGLAAKRALSSANG